MSRKRCANCDGIVLAIRRADLVTCSDACRQVMYRSRLKINRTCSDPFDTHCLDGLTVAADGFRDGSPVCWQCRRQLEKQSPEVAAA